MRGGRGRETKRQKIECERGNDVQGRYATRERVSSQREREKRGGEKDREREKKNRVREVRTMGSATAPQSGRREQKETHRRARRVRVTREDRAARRSATGGRAMRTDYGSSPRSRPIAILCPKPVSEKRDPESHGGRRDDFAGKRHGRDAVAASRKRGVRGGRGEGEGWTVACRGDPDARHRRAAGAGRTRVSLTCPPASPGHSPQRRRRRRRRRSRHRRSSRNFAPPRPH